jgi:uncharacterized membrane protein YesL
MSYTEPPRRKTARDKLIDIYYDSIPMISINLAWFLISILIIPIFPAWVALHYATNQLAHKDNAEWSVFWEGFRKFFWRSYKWGFAIFGGFFILGFNVWFYGQYQNFWAATAQMFFIWLFIFWGLINLYTLPMIMEQEKKSYRLALRNSMVLVGKRLWKTLLLIILIILVVVISAVVPLFFIVISGALIAYMSNSFAVSAVEQLKKEPIKQKPESSSQENENPPAN